MFEIQQHPDDTRSSDFMMRAVYLDYYSKSLSEDPSSEDYLPYSHHMRTEQKYHDMIVKKMMEKDIYPEGIEENPLDSTKDDLEKSGVIKSSVYTLKAG